MPKNHRNAKQNREAKPKTTAPLTHDDLKGAHDDFADTLLQNPSVIAVSIGEKISNGVSTGEPAIKVSVHRKLPTNALAPESIIPPVLVSKRGKAVRTDVEEMEMPSAPLPLVPPSIATAPQLGADDSELRQYHRPVQGGLSAAHYRFDIGTIAITVRDQKQQGIQYLLSNNHVFALLNGATPGDPILEPAPVDGGSYPSCVIARLSRFLPLQLGPGTTNLIDAALAYVPNGYALPSVAWLGQPRTVRAIPTIAVGEAVQKVGRTTGFTTGKIVGIHAAVRVSYAIAGFGNKATVMKEQILTSPMAGYGDSGSLLLDSSQNAVGMLSAGSATTTVYNYMENVQNLMGVDLIS